METNTKNLTTAFTQAITDLEQDVKAAGSNMTELCREAGISRTTPDRWRVKPPATIALVSKLQGIVARKSAAKAQDTQTETKE